MNINIPYNDIPSNEKFGGINEIYVTPIPYKEVNMNYVDQLEKLIDDIKWMDYKIKDEEERSIFKRTIIKMEWAIEDLKKYPKLTEIQNEKK